MPAWGWIVLGAVLLGAEILLPADFFLVFTGLSALVVGLVGALGLVGPIWAQWALFGLLSVASLVLFRRRVHARFIVRGADARVDDTLVGEVAVVRDALSPGSTGQVELRGSVWTARNADDFTLESGCRTRVERVEGLLLHVRRES